MHPNCLHARFINHNPFHHTIGVPVRNLPVAAIIITLTLGAGLACKRSAEVRAAEATTLVRAMHADLLDAQKKGPSLFRVGNLNYRGCGILA